MARAKHVTEGEGTFTQNIFDAQFAGTGLAPVCECVPSCSKKRTTARQTWDFLRKQHPFVAARRQMQNPRTGYFRSGVVLLNILLRRLSLVRLEKGKHFINCCLAFGQIGICHTCDMSRRAVKRQFPVMELMLDSLFGQQFVQLHRCRP